MIGTVPPSADHAAPVTLLARALERKTTTVGDLARLGQAPERDLARLRRERLLARAARARGDLLGQAVGRRSTAPRRRRPGATALTSTLSDA
jgi:hypothetical protein